MGQGLGQGQEQSMVWPMRVRRETPSLAHATLFALMAGALVALSAWSALALTQQMGRIAAFWPANGLLLALLLPLAKRRWPALLLAGYIGNLAANLAMGDLPWLALGLAACNTVEVLIAALFLRRKEHPVYDLAGMATMMEFLAGGVLLSPFFSGLLAAICLHAVAGAPYLRTLALWYPADALGLALMTPLVLAVWLQDARRLFRPGHWPQDVGTLLLVILTALCVFGQEQYPILYLVLPVLMLAVFRNGFLGVDLSIFLVLVVALPLTLHGHGPFWMQRDATFRGSILSLQFYVLVLLASTTPVAVMLARQRLYKQQLREEKMHFRLLADNSRDIVVLSDLQGRRLYASPAVQDVLGWSPEEWTGTCSVDYMHPDDVAAFQAMLAEMASGKDRGAFTYRTRKKDGQYLWMEASLRLLRDQKTGAPSTYVAGLRDISGRMEVEAKLEQAYRQMRQLATLDGLTNLANRRRFDEVLEVEWRRALRSQAPLSLLMIDLDHFKRVNDMYGHRAGDLCLQTVAMVIADCLRRPGDVAARYGGEEFAVVLPNTDVEGALHLAETVRQKVRRAQTDIGVGKPVVLSASVGVACRVPAAYERPDPLVEAADHALYEAKNAGRDRVSAFQEK
ncbi:MAG: diguanylate cyclase domain-containing protein [Acidobacteriaceae bacterium]